MDFIVAVIGLHGMVNLVTGKTSIKATVAPELYCETEGACSASNYTCVDYDCEYHCTGSDSCQNSYFGSSYPSVKVYCEQQSACAESQFYFHGGFNEMSCGGSAACVDAYALSQHAAITHITCNGEHSCDGLYARNSNEASTVIYCDENRGFDACTRITCIEDCTVKPITESPTYKLNHMSDA